MNAHDKIEKVIRDEIAYTRAARTKETQQLAEELARNKDYHLNPHFDKSMVISETQVQRFLSAYKHIDRIIELDEFSADEHIKKGETAEEKAEREADRDPII